MPGPRDRSWRFFTFTCHLERTDEKHSFIPTTFFALYNINSRHVGESVGQGFQRSSISNASGVSMSPLFLRAYFYSRRNSYSALLFLFFLLDPHSLKNPPLSFGESSAVAEFDPRRDWKELLEFCRPSLSKTPLMLCSSGWLASIFSESRRESFLALRFSSFRCSS